jgi:hypothetical protein
MYAKGAKLYANRTKNRDVLLKLKGLQPGFSPLPTDLRSLFSANRTPPLRFAPLQGVGFPPLLALQAVKPADP